jgi:hypothetical protein
VWFDNQSDDIPQYLSPLHTTNMCYDPSVYPLNPSLLHPLLQGPNGPILAFADHMHEGEVVLPDVMPNGYGSVFHFENQEFVEYPSGANGQVKPQIIAWSYTNGCASIVTPRQQLGGVHFGDSEISPYQMFGAIGVYDGSILGKGRIVVESTFHHFVDLNLQGDPVAPVGDPRNLGFKGSDSGGQSILANCTRSLTARLRLLRDTALDSTTCSGREWQPTEHSVGQTWAKARRRCEWRQGARRLRERQLLF